ncbi:MAG: ATP-binding protein, partial [Oscillospiraceae bacterium]|nr:ATP-binding protein [Oscillospiraceae bacterium]
EQEPPKDWTAAFWMLRRYLSDLPENEKHVVFFDEMPWMDTARSGFLPAFEHFWNDYGCALHNLVLIVCGSATSWMTQNIVRNKGGLFSRQTCSIFLEPFTLKETEEYLLSRGIEWSRYDITECYMILGGIPYYLSLLEPGKTLVNNIDNLFFRKRAELWNEFNHLYQTLFENSTQYINIVEALSTKRRGLNRNELIKATGLADNGQLSKMLADLIHSDFVRACSRFGKTRDVCYQLRDYYSWFYFRFIRGYNGRDEHYWNHTYGSPAKNVWAGLTFEQVCKDHIRQIKQKLGISGVLSEESVWSSKGSETHGGAQIDLLIDRRDHVIDLCEIKYAEKEYLIDKEYDQSLRNKREAFRAVTNTRKTIQIVMLTTYGVKSNKYSSIVSDQVVLDDLFLSMSLR